jgi:tRNA nucleotidyltransferase (CCA-adding enzyme)
MPGSSQIDPARLPDLVDALPGIDALRGIAEIVPAYLVGGAVRDLLLAIEGVDLDLAIEGDLEALADAPGFEIEREGLFLTGRLELGELKIDVARTRAESYPHPGALPEVRPAPIADDLARRDFTVNAMAIPLAGDAELLDPHKGVDDLRAGVLRVLHDRSFIGSDSTWSPAQRACWPRRICPRSPTTGPRASCAGSPLRRTPRRPSS